MSVMTLDQKFRNWIQQFNSKQIRLIKERLHTAYIVPDGSQVWVVNSFLLEVLAELIILENLSVQYGDLKKLMKTGDENCRKLVGTLSDMEHFNIVSLLHFICLSEFEKNLTKSEIIDSK